LRAKDIADLLDMSPKTVDTYRRKPDAQLNVHDLVGLVKFANRAEAHEHFQSAAELMHAALRVVALLVTL